MVSGIDPSAAQFLADLAQTQARMNTAQRQVSSGLKFQDASDAPDQVSDILSLRADISRNTQVQSNLGNVKTQVDAAEQAVSNAEQLVEQARTLAAQGLTGTQTAQTRNALAQQVQAIHDQLISLANSQVGNWYVFGGDAPQSAPYAADTNNPDAGGGVVQQTTVQATRQIQDPLGNTFTVDIKVTGAQNVASVPVLVTFDSKVLQLINVSNGDLLSKDGQAVALVHREDTAAGTIQMTASRPPSTAGVSGNGTVFTLTFLAKNPGECTLGVNRAVLRDPNMQATNASGSQAVVSVK